MRFRSVTLHNIRSYTDAKIEFPEKSVLLSGDIGAGKSSILLALEFALFGFRKPVVTGSTLLRKGKSEGYVIVDFEIEDKRVQIKRTLKKSKSVAQGAGYIVVDNVRTDATPVELKSRVLDLLGYSSDLVSKYKDLVFRFTVYTPQEEMKAILFEESDARLNTLRKVFGIDKYKKIRENCSLYLRELRSRRREFIAMTVGIDDLQANFTQDLQRLTEVEVQLINLISQLQEHKLHLDRAESEKKSMDEAANKHNMYKRELSVLDTQLTNIIESHKASKLKLEETRSNILDLGTMEPPMKPEHTDNLAKQLVENNKKILESKERIAVLHSQIERSSLLIEKLSKLEKCPTCMQLVGDGHKHEIQTKEQKISNNLSSEKNSLEMNSKFALEKTAAIEKKLESVHDYEKKQAVYMEKFKSKEMLSGEVVRLEHIIGQQKKEVGAINQKKKETKLNIDLLKLDAEAIAEQEKKISELREQHLALSVKKSAKQQEIHSLEDGLNAICDNLIKKFGYKHSIQNINMLEYWLDEQFINLMGVMEKHVMNTIHYEFNLLFSRWFSMLMDDEIVTAQLDDTFYPIVTMNGHDTELSSLSGGEKTSVALAYRLALNKVINDFQHLKTRNLLILDEPTDGFSVEQLDRVRDLLDSIDLGQIIIVSHEARIESFVDSVLKISKSEHRSQLLMHS